MYRKIKKGLLIALAVFLVVAIVFGIYAGDYVHADLEAISVLSIGMDYEKMERLEDGSLAFYPAEYDRAVIFYPDSKVEAAAYIPLMEHCAQEGMLAILMPMPFNLPDLAKDAAAGIPELYPDVGHWYMAGHGRGGVLAAEFAEENTAFVEGVILLGSSAEMSAIPVLEIPGGQNDFIVCEDQNDTARGQIARTAKLIAEFVK